MVVVRGDYRGDGGVGEVESAEWSRETPTTKTLKSRSSMSGVVVRVVHNCQVRCQFGANP